MNHLLKYGKMLNKMAVNFEANIIRLYIGLIVFKTTIFVLSDRFSFVSHNWDELLNADSHRLAVNLLWMASIEYSLLVAWLANLNMIF